LIEAALKSGLAKDAQSGIAAVVTKSLKEVISEG
jgi:hypothetical protein